MGGLKTGPPRRHRIQPVEGPVLDPLAKETCFKKGSKSGPLEIKSGPPWRVQFWSLFWHLHCCQAQVQLCCGLVEVSRPLFQVEARRASKKPLISRKAGCQHCQEKTLLLGNVFQKHLKSGPLNWGGPFLRARFFVRFEDQNRDLLCHIVLLQFP